MFFFKPDSAISRELWPPHLQDAVTLKDTVQSNNPLIQVNLKGSIQDAVFSVSPAEL
jgi:hypothetical protein